MTELTYKCIIGENKSSPNNLIYEQTLSGKKTGVWVGYCKGDKIHPEHLLRIMYQGEWFILHSKNDPFKQAYKKSNKKRLFEAKKKLRCPIGKVYMNYQKDLTQKLGMNAVDIYRCMGNRKGHGHNKHLVKISHGTLEGKKIPIIVLVMEPISGSRHNTF